ncbi:gliding motility-associated C-terminal domain-containing protein, partial [Saprospiraceae bacterium]|nr:gliding motility-associated C-terminal domain-containing protein [Saprospiraceae bacterium]
GYQGDEFDYQWQDSSTASDFTALETGIYELSVTNECGTVSDQFDLTVLEVDVIETSLQDNYALCTGDSLQIDLTNIFADLVLWNDGSSERLRILTEPGAYFIEFANICSDTLISFYFENKNCLEGELYVPNTFTPNQDGINDVFNVNFSENWLSPEIKVSIYDRWGEQVFYTEEVFFEWDGNFKNRTLNSGVYAYFIELVVEIEGERRLIQKAGDVTIVK